MNEDLEYNFTGGSSVLGGSDKSDPDVSNVPLYKQIQAELAELKKQYHTTDRLSLDDKHFTIEQQLANNKWAVTLIDTIDLMIKEKVKELGDGR